jgi:hypothetical protein
MANPFWAVLIEFCHLQFSQIRGRQPALKSAKDSLTSFDRMAATHKVAQIGGALRRQSAHELISVAAVMRQEKMDDTLLIHALTSQFAAGR